MRARPVLTICDELSFRRYACTPACQSKSPRSLTAVRFDLQPFSPAGFVLRQECLVSFFQASAFHSEAALERRSIIVLSRADSKAMRSLV